MFAPCCRSLVAQLVLCEVAFEVLAPDRGVSF